MQLEIEVVVDDSPPPLGTIAEIEVDLEQLAILLTEMVGGSDGS